MDSKKERLLALVRANPFIGQQELAEALGLSRSAVAGHIAALTRERRLLGRAYVLPKDQPIVCLGGSNIDRKLRGIKPLYLGNSNPASQSESFGGVARNVAENLARLGLPVCLLTAVGQDAAGLALLAQAKQLGIDTSGSLSAPDAPTGSYTAVLNPDGELLLGLAQMDLCERLNPDFLRQCAAQRAQAGLLMLDLNLPQDSVAALLAEARLSGTPLVAVAVSGPKMDRLPEDLQGMDLLLLNRDELSACTGISLSSEAALGRARKQLSQRGLKRLLLTDGSEPLRFCADLANADWQTLKPPKVKVRDVTGAGDAFAAGVCAGLHQDPADLLSACKLGLRLAALTLQSERSVCAELSPTLLQTTA
ncbi:pseudouridine-5-phosphate glycosidase [Paucibacter sp. KBW04]|uniref:carbohydrate kinase n=1 Tax=Paucibacter sp. KBW04 TaxID=2153361 RepID=UPI000F582D53|nr:carbohydrate kinase [Paucibacter sp. KBW04]RQO56909.1 pseudouridine-5-phosphate glycosidase [Paucibacter sp. KBW04]